MKNYVYFWKPKSGLINTCLSQWYIAPFRANGIEYDCAEQYMMAQKALLFGDNRVADLIMKTIDPKEMKALGREVKNFNETVWNNNKERIVYEGNVAKFNDPRNIELKNYLLSTNDSVLVEASPYDRVWGIGMDYMSAKYIDENQWNGQNLLGKILMKVRTDIR